MFAVPPPAASFSLKSALVTRTDTPDWLHVPFQPPAICCSPVGQSNVSVQPSIGLTSLLVMSMLATKPLPQSVTSEKRTAQVLLAGVPVVTVSGGDAHETMPFPWRARTLKVYRLPGFRFCTVNEVAVVSPICSLVVPFCRKTSYLRFEPATAGHEMVADRSVTALATGWPGAPGLTAAGVACMARVVSE